MLRALSPRFLSTCTKLLRPTEGESRISGLLRNTYKNASLIEVEDISNGCGSMYRVIVHTPEFKGLTKVVQHKQITNILKDDIKSMHGLVIETKAQ